MKILLLAPCPFYQHRGTPIAIRLVVEVLAEAGHQVQVLTYPEGDPVRFPNTLLVRVPSLLGIKGIKPGPSWKKLVYDGAMFFTLIGILRKQRFDVIHAVEESAFMAQALKRFFHIPYVYDMDSSLSRQISEKYRFLKPLESILHFFEKRAIRGSLGAIAVCKALEEEVVRCSPLKPVCRLEDISLISDRPDEKEAPFKAASLDPVIMYVGNLEKYQGLELLLEGFQRALPDLGAARLVIIGGGEKQIHYYRRQARDLGIEDRVDFLGPRPVSELSSWLGRAEILVSPRIQGNNTPMKIFSYLDSGKPVLATRLPTHTQVLDDEIACLISPDPRDLARGLVLLMQDSGLRERLGREGKKRVQEDYCFEAFQRKLLQFYAQLEKDLKAPGRQ